MLKNVTIAIEEELQRQMRQTDEYWDAYRRWKELGTGTMDLEATHRLSRDKAHFRGSKNAPSA